MILLTLLILSSTSNVIVETKYLPYLGIGKINIKSLLKQDSITLGNSTSDYLNITELASESGYIIQEYKVTTEDGYILGLHRLKNNVSKNSVPVFLMHGLLDSSDSWILQGPNTSLAYNLIDAGYDVWMGNARGNKYSAAHTQLNPDEETFWKFSWEQIGVYDLPAMIDHVLTTTDTKSLYYVGHSQGTTCYFVMNSLKPEYGSKIKTMFALSPIAWLSHADSPVLKYVSTVPATLLHYVQSFNTSPTNILYQIYSSICQVASTRCGSTFEMFFGTNYFVSEAMLPIILRHASSSSVLQLVHFWQLYESGRFCRFDYGWMRNLYEYGSFSPPDYELSDVTAPVILFFSGNDRLSHPSDVVILHGHLPNVYVTYYSEYFSHIDYLYASVAKEVVYDKIIEHIQQYEQHRNLNSNGMDIHKKIAYNYDP